MIRPKLSAEIDSFFEIGFAGCEFAADGKVTGPGFAAVRHADLHLLAKFLGEEFPAKLLHAMLKRFIHVVSDDVKEAVLPACPANFSRDVVPGRCSVDKRIYVYDRNARRVMDCSPAHGVVRIRLPLKA